MKNYKMFIQGFDFGPFVTKKRTGVIRDIAGLFDSSTFEASNGVKLQYAHFTPPEANICIYCCKWG